MSDRSDSGMAVGLIYFAIVFIAVDILVIWALTLHGRAVGAD